MPAEAAAVAISSLLALWRINERSSLVSTITSYNPIRPR
jgi:hypothetical protein